MAQHYDIVVIGTQPAAVLAAALFAKRHRRVLLVDHCENSATYSRNGYLLPLVPLFLPQLESSAPLQRVHEELGLGPELRAATKTLTPSLQVVLPGHRFDLHPQPEPLLEELRREFPRYGDQITDFVAKIFATDKCLNEILRTASPVTPATLVERWQARSWLRASSSFARPFLPSEWLVGVPDEHPLVETMLAPLFFFGHLGPHTPSVFHAVRLLARHLRGVVVFANRLSGLPAFLQSAARRVGVEVRESAAVERVHSERRRLTKISLLGDRQDISADYFISGTVDPFCELLSEQAPLAREEQAVRATSTLIVLNLVVRRQVIPCGMGEVLMLHNGRKRMRDGSPSDPPLLLQRFAAACASRREDAEGKEVLSIACPVKTADYAHSPDRLAAMKLQIVARVARLLPFLSEHIESISLTADTGSWDLLEEGSRRIDPWRLHPLYEAARPPLLGIAARSPRTYFKNLWHCGHDVVPGLGIEGDYITAIATADAITRTSSRSAPRPR